MSIVRWRPFNEFMSLREAMDSLFEESFVWPNRWLTWRASEAVPVDMYQTDAEVVIKAALPGVRPEDVEVTVLGDTVTIKGETKANEKFKDENCICQETRYGSFYRELTIPIPVAMDKAEAKFENGMLYLTLPKAEEVRPKQIKVAVQPVLEAKAESRKEAKK